MLLQCGTKHLNYCLVVGECGGVSVTTITTHNNYTTTLTITTTTTVTTTTTATTTATTTTDNIQSLLIYGQLHVCWLN